MNMLNRDNVNTEEYYLFTEETALHYAAKYSKLGVIRALIAKKANVHHRDYLGKSLLFLYCT